MQSLHEEIIEILTEEVQTRKLLKLEEDTEIDAWNDACNEAAVKIEEMLTERVFGER